MRHNPSAFQLIFDCLASVFQAESKCGLFEFNQVFVPYAPKQGPEMIAIFVTAYPEYVRQILEIKGDYIVLKPYTREEITDAINRVRLLSHRLRKKAFIKTFGEFEVFVDGSPMQFGYLKTKEILAFLVESRGSMCTNGRLIDVLWDDDDASSHRSYFGNLLSDLSKTLKEYDCEDILIRRRGQMGIDTTKIECDYYNWLDGDPNARAAFKGEYMSQYSWGEYTLASLFYGQEDK